MPSVLEAKVRRLPALREWETRVFPGVRLDSEARAVVEQWAAAGERRLDVVELREGLQVTARSWVGVVRLGDVELRIVPKLTGEWVDLVRLLELVSGIDGLSRTGGVIGLQVAGESLLDLVALLFTEACEGVVRRGLLSGYVEREEWLPVVRGRLLADRQVLQRFGRIDRLACRFDELEHDVDENRLLAAALRRAHGRVQNAGVRRRMARLRSVIEPVCDEQQLDLRAARSSIQYDRLNSHYAEAHALAWLLLDGLGVDDLFVAGRTRSFAFLLDMNLLFERFVELLVRQAAPPDCRVAAQSKQHSIIWNATARKSYASVIPDLLVERRGVPSYRIAIDAKYKTYDEKKLDPSDIYQTFLYAYALSEQPDLALPTALILYPASIDCGRPLRLQVRPSIGRGGAEILAMPISIPNAVAELRAGRPGEVLAELGRLLRELVGERDLERAVSRAAS